MADKVIIYLGHKGEAVQWAVANPSTHQVLEEGRGSLEDAAKIAHGRRVVVLVPSEEVFLTEVSLPVRNTAKARIAIPNMLEEELSEDIDSLHFALGKPHDGATYPVAVMSKLRIEYYQKLLGEHGVRIEKLMPSVLALPFAEGHWSALQEGDEVVVRESVYQGFSCAPDNLDLFFRQALQDVESDESPVVHTFQHEVDIPEELGVKVELQPAKSLIHVFAQGIEQGLVINLLQGEFKPLRKENPNWERWKLTAALAATVAVVWFSVTFYEAYRLKQENQRLSDEIVAIYQRAFPGANVVNPKVQMEQKLKQLKQGASDGGGFLAVLNTVSAEVSKAENTSFKGLNYRKGQLEFDVEVKDLKSLETLKTQLAGKGVRAEIVTAKSEEGVVNGRVRVQ